MRTEYVNIEFIVLYYIGLRIFLKLYRDDGNGDYMFMDETILDLKYKKLTKVWIYSTGQHYVDTEWDIKLKEGGENSDSKN